MRELPEPTRLVSVIGMFIGVYVETLQPVLFKIEGVNFLPIFSTPEKYHEAMRIAKPDENQPDEKSRFWIVVQWWFDQGAKVVDGVGVWTEPKIISKRYRKYRRGLIEDAEGDVELRFYEGYEQWGPIK